MNHNPHAFPYQRPGFFHSARFACKVALLLAGYAALGLGLGVLCAL